MSAAPAASMLEIERVAVSFGAVQALANASMKVRAGTIHALLGENGAGKTTLMRVVHGALRPDDGRLRLDGEHVRFDSTADAIRAGVGMVHQHFTNVAAMTVAENVALGGRGHFDATAAASLVHAIGRETGLRLDPASRVADLSVGGQQRLEIVKALAHHARLLILDEPTAVLAPSEAEDLLRWLRTFVAANRAVILITHRLAEALDHADDVTVLRRGTTVLTTPAAETNVDELATAMLGDVPPRPSTPAPTVLGEAVLTLEDVRVSDERGQAIVDHVTVTIHGGEIVGMAALENAGHLELLRAMAGRQTIARGHIARGAPTAYIPEDRHRDALILGFDLPSNVALRGASARRGRFRPASWRALTARLLSRFDVRGTVHSRAGALSGGNQQKLVLARELRDEPRLIVAVNPTRGLDVRASAAVHEHLRAAAAAGAGVVVYSSDLDEVLSLATRMLAVHAGRVHVTPLDRDAVGRAMLGLS